MAARTRMHGGRLRGMTLVEQVTVLAIIALLLCIATPALFAMLQVNHVRLAQNDVIAALQYARATAATRGTRVLMCPSVDHEHCAPSTRWEGGWLIGSDANRDNQPDPGSRYVGGDRARHVRVRSSAGRQLVRFQADGSAGGSNLTLTVCAEDSHARPLAIVVSNSGRVRSAPATATQATSCRSDP